MAAGLGFKDFVTGEVLTAGDVDGYLMQGVWVFADTAARTSAVTSPQEGNFSFLKDTNSTEYYDGSAWVSVGGGASGMTKIATGTFSAVSTVDIDNVFSTSYATYFAYISVLGSVNDADLELQYRYAGPSTETGASYYSSFGRIDTANSASGHGVSAGTQAKLNLSVGSSTREAKVAIWFNGVGQASADEPVYQGTSWDGYSTQAIGYIGGFTITDRIYTGIRVKPSSGTITGNYAIYGLAI
jgi:hypothetical protein